MHPATANIGTRVTARVRCTFMFPLEQRRHVAYSLSYRRGLPPCGRHPMGADPCPEREPSRAWSRSDFQDPLPSGASAVARMSGHGSGAAKGSWNHLRLLWRTDTSAPGEGRPSHELAAPIKAGSIDRRAARWRMPTASPCIGGQHALRMRTRPPRSFEIGQRARLDPARRHPDKVVLHRGLL